MMNRFGGYGRIPQNNVGLAEMNQNHLIALSQQGNPSHEQLMEMQAVQQGMREVAGKRNIEVPKVNFYPSRHPDPRKARKQDIRQARKLLRPTKRTWLSPLRWVGLGHRYNRQSNLCVVDGCNCEELIKYDNLYAKITDEETGKSLWELYWKNPVTSTPEPFVAREKVTNGQKMKGTYCPEHLHLYHLLCKWEAENDKDHNTTKRGMREMVKKGVSTVAVPVAVVKKKDNTPEFLKKYEPFFIEVEKDSKVHPGISLIRYQNPHTGINDITGVLFDMRMFQKELLASRPELADALTNLGIMQAQPNAVPQSLTEMPTNDVITQGTLPTSEDTLFTQ